MANLKFYYNGNIGNKETGTLTDYKKNTRYKCTGETKKALWAHVLNHCYIYYPTEVSIEVDNKVTGEKRFLFIPGVAVENTRNYFAYVTHKDEFTLSLPEIKAIMNNQIHLLTYNFLNPAKTKIIHTNKINLAKLRKDILAEKIEGTPHTSNIGKEFFSFPTENYKI